MKKIIYIMIIAMTSFAGQAFAAGDNITGIDDSNLRNGNVSFNDIPKAIQNATTFLLGFAATIAMIMIIVGALKYSLGSVEGSSPNKQKAQETIKYGLMGFIISVSSWFIINLVISNL